MQVLNLVRPEKSDIKYKIIQFPDGEPHIVLEEINRKKDVEIICRVSNPNDLFILLQVEDILKRQEVIFSIKIYYFMSMRMDRVISFNESYSLKLVVDMIKRFEPFDVAVFESHSDKCPYLLGCINEGIYNEFLENVLNSRGISDFTLVFPDEGANDRYFTTKPFITCAKHRDPSTGNLLSFEITDDSQDNPELPFMVVDDLCDGGGTFAGIATLLKSKYPNRGLNIYVTHMVNPKGIRTLSEYYDNVYFTNSYRDWQSEILPANVKVIEVV